MRAAPRRSARTGRTSRRRRAPRPRGRRTRSRSPRRSCRRRRAAPRRGRGGCRASARTRSPSAVTSSNAVTALVCRPCLRASQPMPAAERVAGDAHVRRRAVQAREPVRGQARRDAVPLDAGADADAPGAGVDADLLERGDVQQQRAPRGRRAAPGCARSPAGRRAARRPGRRRRRAATSSAFAGNATAAGCWSRRRLKPDRASSQPGIAGQDDGAGERLGEQGVSRREHATMVGGGASARRSRKRGVIAAGAPPAFEGGRAVLRPPKSS